MKLDLCDLHCDTPYEMLRRGEALSDGDLDVNLNMTKCYDSYVQLAAYCAPYDMSDDEAYELALSVYDNFKSEAQSALCSVASTSGELSKAVCSGERGFVLTLEDGRVVGDDESRLMRLYDTGVRVITLLWGGETVIGGSFESSAGLTDVGKNLARRCCLHGIILDISHASERSAYDTLEIAAAYGKPVIASHSCMHAVNPHPRNIRDEQMRAVSASGGIVGINLYPPHLTGCDRSDISDAVRHIFHAVQVIGDDRISLGCDFDGMDYHTTGLERVSSLTKLANELMRCGMSEESVRKIFFKNAFNFLINNL